MDTTQVAALIAAGSGLVAAGTSIVNLAVSVVRERPGLGVCARETAEDRQGFERYIEVVVVNSRARPQFGGRCGVEGRGCEAILEIERWSCLGPAPGLAERRRSSDDVVDAGGTRRGIPQRGDCDRCLLRRRRPRTRSKGEGTVKNDFDVSRSADAMAMAKDAWRGDVS